MKIHLSGAKKIKTIYGFGVSAAWWSTKLADEKTADEVAKMLYGDSGLRLNIYRYNVGGGYEEDNLRIANPWRYIESFMNSDGSYDWSADANAVGMMKRSLALGNIDTLIFFANSPHYTQTVTHQTSGGLTEHFSNLAKDKYRAFANYFIDIAEHFAAEGYPVKYISPINEPQWKWGGSYVWQEGCHYEPEEVRDCYRVFAEELERRGSSLMLYGPESGNISELTKEYYILLSADELIMKRLYSFAYHSYGSDDDLTAKISFGKWAKRNVRTPRFDMSEWCELPCKNDTRSITSALINARVIGEDLIYSGADSWTAWVGANQTAPATRNGKCYSDGLLTAADDWSEYYICMRYWAMAHFSKFIPVGSKSLDIGYLPSRKLSVFAFRTPDGKRVVVASNESNADRVLEPDIDFGEAKVFTTTQEKQLCESTQKKKIAVPAKSIVTAIF